jgi:hypothetical protein
MELGYHVTQSKILRQLSTQRAMVATSVNAILYDHAILTTNELLAALPALAPSGKAA